MKYQFALSILCVTYYMTFISVHKPQ